MEKIDCQRKQLVRLVTFSPNPTNLWLFTQAFTIEWADSRYMFDLFGVKVKAILDLLFSSNITFHSRDVLAFFQEHDIMNFLLNSNNIFLMFLFSHVKYIINRDKLMVFDVFAFFQE